MITFPYISSDFNWTFFIKGKPVEINPTHSNYNEIIRLVFDKDKNNDDKLISLIETGKIFDELNQIYLENIITTKYGSFVFTAKNGKINVTYNDFSLPNVLAEKLISLYSAGCTDYSHFEKFVENILKNPNKGSVESLYDFLTVAKLPLTDDGCFIAYKGIQKNYYSKTGNIDTRVIQGKVNNLGQILNKIGETIEIVASDVDDNREVACSVGLHVGSYEYANSFGERIIAVKVNPQYVISVPYDANCQKCRVSQYEVICDIEKKIESPDVMVEGKDLKVNNNRIPKKKVTIDSKFDISNYLTPEFREAVDRNICNHVTRTFNHKENRLTCDNEDGVVECMVKDCAYVFYSNQGWLENSTTLGQLRGSVGRKDGLNNEVLLMILQQLNYNITLNNKALGKSIVRIK